MATPRELASHLLRDRRMQIMPCFRYATPFFAAALLLIAPSARAKEGPNRSASPYFFVEGDPSVDQLPLRDTRVHYDITGVIAEVSVTQRYENHGTRPIHARYVFPASTQAAVHGMKMTIGDRVIEAKIRERAEAEREFAEAKREGKSASLLQEERPNVFTMEVANVMPGDRIDVELHYTELLVPEAGVYEFVYPTVVGPRYVSHAADGSVVHDAFAQSPYLPDGKNPIATFELTGTIAAGVPVRAISSPSHAIHTMPTTAAGGVTAVTLTSSEPAANRDFILRYQLRGDRVASGLSLYQGRDESFFMLMVQPPERPRVEDIPSREYVFIVDVSGSMHGFPLTLAKSLLRNLIGSLRPTDRFNVLLFSGDSRLMAPASVPATREHIAEAIRVIDDEKGAGGTELLPAMQRAMSLPFDDRTARSFVVITDGFIEEEEGVYHYIRDHVGKANVFSFGIGSSVNRHLIEGVASAGLGEPFVVTNEKEGPSVVKRFADYLRAPVLTAATVRFDGFDAYDIEPKVLPTVFAERPVIVRGKWRGKPTGSVTLEGVNGQGRFSQRIDVASVTPLASNEALTYLWARSCIADLSGLADAHRSDALRKEIVSVGLKYNLLTEFTSFIAIDPRIRERGDRAVPVEQPVPLPAGVEDGSVEVGDEPSLVLMLAALALMGVLIARARRQALCS
jgi:Ca-activated chloride channel family protein